ncbi:MAG: ABC transporter substrate binding protein [Mariprofundaceae bacterium]|nr:ABC transporter substrate binding protein [Mariprofundaceae bacterium]
MLKTLFFCLSVYCITMLAPIEAQADGIAIISHANIKPYQLAIAGFREQVNLPIHIYHLDNRGEQHSAVALDIAQQQPELIFALGKLALNFTRHIHFHVPVVFIFVLHPNNPSSGHQHQPSEFGIAMSIAPAQQFKMLIDIAPSVKHIAVVYNPKKSASIIQQAKIAAKNLGIHLLAVPADNQKMATSLIASVMPKVDAMWMIPDITVLTSTTFKQMLHLSLKYTVVLIGLAPKYVRAGCLFALSFDSHAIGSQAGAMVKRILAGKKVANQVPPNRVYFTLNKQAAKQLGLYLPTSLLKKVDHLYGERK